MTTEKTGKGHGDKRPRLQEAAIAALLSHPTLDSAAKAAGVSRATLFRWTQEPDFQAAYRDARRQAMDGAIATLQAATAEAVAALRKALREKGSTRVTAARAIWEFSFRSRELLDIEERLATLEQRFGGQEGQNR
jgi:AcrR family transcriptional regulator